MALGETLHLSVPQLLHLYMGDSLIPSLCIEVEITEKYKILMQFMLGSMIDHLVCVRDRARAMLSCS